MTSSAKNGGSDKATPEFYAASAAERLVDSRKKLVRYMSQGSVGYMPITLPSEEKEKIIDFREAHQPTVVLGAWNLIKLGANRWWRHHPANIALAVTSPLLKRYAERKPFQLLTISAGAGIAIVLLKPWRLVSIGGLTLTALKSSEFSTLVASLLTSKEEEESFAKSGDLNS